ncbi:MAG: hypothetical protein LBG89_01430 [Rickettsiales bacterium]|jgi:hypothetical protein|nr:hypothetical protein [Rickettsiales bacterium]
MSFVISAWICAGKTFIIENYKNVTEIASGNYKYLLTDEQKSMPPESLKSTQREINPYWPNNYVDAVIEAMKKYEVVLVAPGKIIYDLLRERGVDCILAVPNIYSKEEYKRRAKQRGNNDAFLQRIEENLEKDAKEMLAEPNKKIILKQYEFLEDALLREGILKEPSN